MKIGILGGTFNPPHCAHLIIAEHVRLEAGLDTILFVPSYISPHKQRGEDTNASDRLSMTRKAIRGNPHFECCEYEVLKRTVSYTYETLEFLKATYAGSEFTLLIGMDNFLGLASWKHPEKITALANIIVMNRPDTGTGWPEGIPHEKVSFVTVPNLEISSSAIRRRAAEGKSITYLVPLTVEHYILSHHLYTKNQ
jgi:nicotinate-nucleotide adenylyltransferase